MNTRTQALLGCILSFGFAGCMTPGAPSGEPLDASHWRTAKADLYEGLAFKCLRAGDHERAKKLLEQAVQFDGGADQRTLELLMRIAYAQEDLETAGNAALMLLAADEQSISALCTLGAVAESSQRSDEAAAFYAKAAAVAGANPRPLLDLHRLHLTNGDDVAAKSVRQEFVAKFPGRVDVWVDQGARLAAEGRWSEAATSYDRALAVAPGNVDVASRRAMSALALGRPSDALPLSDKLAPHLRVRSAALGLARAAARLEAGLPADALRELDLIETTPAERGSLQLLRGEILLRLRKFDKAEEALQVAVDLGTQPGRAHAALGRLHLSRGQMHVAARELEAAIDANPDAAANHVLLAIARSLNADHEAASRSLERARRLGASEALPFAYSRRFGDLAKDPAKGEGGR